MSFWISDLDAFFNEFAVEMETEKYQGIKVIFTNTFELGLNVENSVPIAFAKQADVSTIKNKDVVTIDNVSYSVIGKHEGNDGTSQLLLSKVI